MSQNSSLDNVYDFNSQKGIASLLGAVRNSDLNADVRNEIRDLIFLYTNGGGDQSVRLALEKKLITHQIKLITPTKKEEETKVVKAPILPFGSSRPSPVFKAPISVPKVPAVAQPETKKFVPSSSFTPVASQTPAPKPEKTAEVEKGASVFTPATQNNYSKARGEIESVTKTVPEPVTETPKVAPVMTDDISQFLNRIREIKSIVNNKVGNPVNLVDIDNKVGREYMTALLEAMKSLSGGPSGKLQETMTRLETAFKAVGVAIESHASKALVEQNFSVSEIKKSDPVETVAPAPSQAPAPVTVSTPILTPTEIKQVPVSAEVTTNIPTPPVASDSNSVLSQPSRPVTVPPVPTPVTAPKPTPVIPEFKPAPAPAPAPVPKPAAPRPEVTTPELKPEPVNNSWSTVANSTPSTPKDVVAPVEPVLANNFTATSILDDKKLMTPSDLPERKDDPSTNANPLYTQEIDQGLEQLLSDWSLFKKSGLFGTGPKGKEHPLYKKIAELQIPLLLSGRFEGSTQEIRQSITDYMNGWRYEQGIIYEKGETFEQYLRRVIKQILDLQKKRLPS